MAELVVAVPDAVAAEVAAIEYRTLRLTKNMVHGNARCEWVIERKK